MSNSRYTLDSNEQAFFLRQLEEIRSQLFDLKVPVLKGLQLVPLYSPDPGAELVTYRQYQKIGSAKKIDPNANDVPTVNTIGKEYSTRMTMYGDKIHYTIQDIKNAAKAGLPLETKLFEVARRAIDEAIDFVAAFGDSAAGQEGLLNLSNTLSFTLLNDGTGSSKAFADKTGVQMLRDLNAIRAYVPSQTLEVEHIDTIVMPLAQLELIKSTPIASGGITQTVYQYFLANQDDVKQILSWTRCSGAGSSTSDRLVGFRRDPTALQLLVNPMEVLAPQPKGFGFDVHCSARTGGVQCFYPKSVVYADHI